MATPVQMPKQGNSVEECLIVEWMVEEGRSVGEGDTLCSIETDKATFEVVSPVSGTLLKRFFPEGELAPILQLLAKVEKMSTNLPRRMYRQVNLLLKNRKHLSLQMRQNKRKPRQQSRPLHLLNSLLIVEH
ncbi:MAG: biotin/lipoyl-containing protein [Planctomycetota bacterium]|jgi:pyruvate/2-oxoglutarate dehydrogenase complex dihydrolipoamide acyltransferase (E2) component